MELRELHRHDKIHENMKKIDRQDPKADPNRWSQLKKVYIRINKRVKDIGEDVNDVANLKRAAAWLDLNEKKEQSMAKYVSFLRQRYYNKRKLSNS